MYEESERESSRVSQSIDRSVDRRLVGYALYTLFSSLLFMHRIPRV